MIHLSEVHKHYREEGQDNHVLRGVSLNVDAGEFVALMGASGSGKSTLLNVIGGIDGDYEGEVLVGGQSLRGLGDRALSRFRNRTVSFVFQQFHLLPHLTVLDNVIMPSWFDRSRRGEDRSAQARALVERVGLGGRERGRPGHLSGGEKQRVAIARALLNRPRFLLADEPTGALDTESGQQVMDIFRELNAQDGLTVLVVTHEQEVASRCQRIMRIRDGVRVGEGE